MTRIYRKMNQQWNLTNKHIYQIMKKYLAIFLLMLVVPLTISAQQTITVTGTVTDTQDEPMIGVNITVKDVAGV